MKKVYIVTIFMLFCVLTACGSSTASNSQNDKDEAIAESSFKLTDFSEREVLFSSTPKNIVSLSGGDMEIIYALGGKVVGRPTSTHTQADEPYKSVEQIGSTHEYDLEKITSLKPDLVIGNNPLNKKDIQSLESIGAKVILTHANSVEDIQKQITLYGDLLQKQEKATELNKEIQTKVDEISNQQTDKKTRTLLVYGAPGTYMAALSNSLSGNILELAGGENIASDYPALEQYPQYAQLNTERIIESNPEYVFLLTHGNPEDVKAGFLKEMEENPAWNQIDAVKNNRVEILPAQLFGTNPGTQVTESIDYLNKLLKFAN